MEDPTTSRAFVVFTSFTRNVADLIFFVTLGLYYKVMWSKKVFHANLELLLFLFPLAYVVALVPAIVRDIVGWFVVLETRQSDFFDMVIDMGQYSASYNLLVLVIERAIATIYVSRYEYMFVRPWLASLLALIQWCACITVLFINYYYKGRVIDMEPLIVSVAVSCGVAALVFALLPLISKFVHRRIMRERFSNDRYQSVENIRSAKLLRRLVFLTVIAQLLCGGIYSHIKENCPWPYIYYILNLYYVLLALFASLLCNVVLHAHPTLRREYYRLTGLDKYLRRNRAQEISSVGGGRLDIPLSEQSEFYFRSYRNSW